MALSGNKGEWSEIYTLFKLLGDGKLYAGDADMNVSFIYYPILNIIRKEARQLNYKPNHNGNVIIEDDRGSIIYTIPMQKFSEEADVLFKQITDTKESAFELPNTESFMAQVGCTKLKASSKDKSDIHIVLHDFITGMNPLLGFSIKSQLGSPSTLLNAGLTTNIRYMVVGGNITSHDIEVINAIDNHKSRMQAIIDKGWTLEYADFDNQTFKNNLMFIDCCLPEFIAKCLSLANVTLSTESITDVVNEVCKLNPFKFGGDDIKAFYEHKMKQLLLNAALGMTPATPWKGKFDANGGYLIVKKDGDIICYHFYNYNDVEDYLYNNSRFENASRSRYHFGSLETDEAGNVFIKLNLQIRFKR